MIIIFLSLDLDDFLRLLDILIFLKVVPTLNWLQIVFVTTKQIMQNAILMVAIVPQTLLPQPNLQLLDKALQIQQQLEDATRDGLVMDIVMISITTWTAAMMAEIVVGVMFKHHTVRYVDALIQMEVVVEQLAHNQQRVQQPKVRQQCQHQLQPSQLCQQLMTQVI